MAALREIVAELRRQSPPVNWQGDGPVKNDGSIPFGFVINTDAQTKALQALFDHGLVFYDALNSVEMHELYESIDFTTQRPTAGGKT